MEFGFKEGQYLVDNKPLDNCINVGGLGGYNSPLAGTSDLHGNVCQLVGEFLNLNTQAGNKLNGTLLPEIFWPINFISILD